MRKQEFLHKYRMLILPVAGKIGSHLHCMFNTGIPLNFVPVCMCARACIGFRGQSALSPFFIITNSMAINHHDLQTEMNNRIRGHFSPSWERTSVTELGLLKLECCFGRKECRFMTCSLIILLSTLGVGWGMEVCDFENRFL